MLFNRPAGVLPPTSLGEGNRGAFRRAGSRSFRRERLPKAVEGGMVWYYECLLAKKGVHKVRGQVHSLRISLDHWMPFE